MTTKDDIQFKTKKIERDYKNKKGRSPGNLKLREYLDILNRISVMLGFGPILLTDYLRQGSKYLSSLHHKDYGGRAADIRIRDKSIVWYLLMVTVGKAIELVDPSFRMNHHPELFKKRSKHIHIEIREK